jgi:hypothetical protein
MPLGGMLPYPNPLPGGGGMAPPPNMGQPPPGPTADKYIAIIAQLYGQNPAEIKSFMGGIGFMELLKKMDLGKRQRIGAEGVAMGGPQMTPQLAALKSMSPTSMAAPLAMS